MNEFGVAFTRVRFERWIVDSELVRFAFKRIIRTWGEWQTVFADERAFFLFSQLTRESIEPSFSAALGNLP